MALAIDYDGFGVVANADRETNDTAGGTGDWKELGGGTIGFNPDVPYYEGGADGPGSMGSKYASKNGYSYIDGITALDFDVAGAQEGEYLYSWVNIQSAGAFQTLATDGLSIMAGSLTSDSNHWKVVGSDDANGWSGGWKLFVVDPTIVAGTVVNGTRVLSAIDTIGIWIDTAVSVRADSIFQSQIICCKGLIVTGSSTVIGEGLDEIANWSTDLLNRAAGVFQKRGNTYFSLGSLTVGDGSILTVLSAYGNNVEYEESSYWNGSAWVSSFPATANNIVTTANASIDFVNTGVAGFIDNKVAIDTSLGNASSFAGGYLNLLRSVTVKASDTFNGVVFGNNDALSLGAASYDNCSFNTSGTITIDATTSSFSGNSFNPNTATDALSTTSLDYMIDGAFTSGGTGHATTLTGAAASHAWDATAIGYDSGSTGDGVEITGGSITGDETIHITAASGTFIINVSDTATVPSVSSAGAIVNVVAGQKTLTFSQLPSGVEVRIRQGSFTIHYTANVVSGTDSYAYTYTPNIHTTITVGGSGYIRQTIDYTLTNADASLIFALDPDPSYIL